jgi:hypothetical protein
MEASPEMHYLQFVFLVSDIPPSSSFAFRVRRFGLFKFRINSESFYLIDN